MSLVIATTLFLLNLTYQDRYEAYVKDIAPKYELRVELVEALIETESHWDDETLSKSGAVGLMQIVPKWHEARMDRLLIEDIAEPYSNIMCGCDYLAELIDRYGNEAEALMVYNMGGKGAELYESGNVSKYASHILARANELKEDKK